MTILSVLFVAFVLGFFGGVGFMMLILGVVASTLVEETLRKGYYEEYKEEA